jgi:hypothetical protein
MIQQMAAVVARLRERLSGPRAVAEAADVEREAGAGITHVLGPQAGLLQQLDANSAARIVGDGDRVALWVAFLRVQADAQRAAGRGDAADRVAMRAAALEAAARAAWPEKT